MQASSVRLRASAASPAAPAPLVPWCAGALSVALAILWWPHVRWVNDTAAPVAWRASVLVGVMGAYAYVLWSFRRWLNERFAFHAADPWIGALLAVFGVDLVAQLQVVASGAPGFRIYTYPLGLYRIALAYPHFACLGAGVIYAALGYSLLRFPDDLNGRMRACAYAQVSTGAVLASLSFAGWAVIPAIAGHLLVGLILVGAAAGDGGRDR